MKNKKNQKNIILWSIIVFVSLVAIVLVLRFYPKYTPDNHLSADDLDYYLGILVPEGMNNEEWLGTVLYEDECGYTGANYFQVTRHLAENLADYTLSKNIIVYTGSTKISLKEQKDIFSKLVFKWQYEFDKQNGQLHTHYKRCGQWTEYLQPKMSDPEIEFEIIEQKYWEGALGHTYLQSPDFEY